MTDDTARETRLRKMAKLRGMTLKRSPERGFVSDRYSYTLIHKWIADGLPYKSVSMPFTLDEVEECLTSPFAPTPLAPPNIRRP
jgi:hypothetical protein